MKWLTPKAKPPAFPRQVANSYFKGAHMMRDNILWGVPFLALEAATAKPGEQLPTLTGRLGGLALQPTIAGGLAAASTALLGLPPAAAAIAGVLLAAYASGEIENRMIRGLTWVTQEGQRARRLEFGGDYRDTETSLARRKRALRDLAGAMPPARQWLGQEALMLHR